MTGDGRRKVLSAGGVARRINPRLLGAATRRVLAAGIIAIGCSAAGLVVAGVVAASVALPSSAHAQQTLEQRVAAVGSGTVRLSYPAKEGVCGNGSRGNISYRPRDDRNSTAAREWEDDCEPGPVRLALDVENRRVTRIRAYVGGRWRGEADRDLGDVSAAEASAYLMQIAATAEERAAKDAIFPALMADAPAPALALLAIAKDERRPREVRTNATFWVAQSAGDRVSEGLQELTNDPDKQVRESAVFSLSQRPNDESVPALIRLARTHRDPSIRRNAVFWLGQKRDPRALAYFEEVLAPR